MGSIYKFHRTHTMCRIYDRKGGEGGGFVLTGLIFSTLWYALFINIKYNEFSYQILFKMEILSMNSLFYFPNNARLL